MPRGGGKGSKQNGDGPGLRQMIAATPEGLCPFCLDPVQEKMAKGRPSQLHWQTCGDPVCRQAWWRTYARDRRLYKKGLLPHALPATEG